MDTPEHTLGDEYITTLHVVTAAYSAYHSLDPAHTYGYAAGLCAKLDPLLTTHFDGQMHLTAAGIVILTMKLEKACAMGRLRRPDGSTSYKR
jgi:hypothetical protein